MRMKTLGIVAGLCVAGVAQAQQENTGCGLGTMLFDGQEGIAPQVLAVTTNGTSGNQTFGITSGTLGCTQDGVVKSSKKLSMFLDRNLDRVAQDMSAGQGERLETLAGLLGIPATERDGFYDLTRRHFAEIYPSPDVSVAQVLRNLNGIMAADSRYAGYAS